jgi:hypothetical protein
MARVNEQMHGIQINQGSEEFVVERVRVFQSAGDGIRLLGEPSNKARKIWVQGCRLIQNKRSGIGVQRAVEFAWIRDCYIEGTPPTTDACIHFEPTSNVAPTDITIDGNVLVHGTDASAVAIAGISATDPAQRIKFTNNTLQGGGVAGGDALDVTVAGNTIVAGSVGPVVTFRSACSGLRIASNKIVALGDPRTAVVVANAGNITSSEVSIEVNHIETTGGGILINHPGSHVEIRGNRLFGSSFGAIGILVHLEVQAPPFHRNFSVVGNTLANFRGVGIQFLTNNTSAKFDGVLVHGNHVYLDAPGEGLPVGISFGKPGQGTEQWLRGPMVSNNYLNTFTKIERDLATVPFFGIGGNIGDCEIFEGQGPPNGVVAAPVGSLYVRLDAQSDTALYVKQTGSDAAGWRQTVLGP